YYLLNQTADSVIRISDNKFISSHPGIRNILQRQAQALLGHNDLNQIILAQDSLIRYLKSTVENLENLEQSQRDDIKSFSNNLSKINLLLEQNKADFSVRQNKSETVVEGTTSKNEEHPATLINAGLNTSIPILKNIYDFQELYRDRAEEDLYEADSLLIILHKKEALEIYLSKISEEKDPIAKSFLLSKLAENYTPAEQMEVRLSTGQTGELKFGESYKQANDYLTQALKYYPDNFEAYEMLIQLEASDVTDKLDKKNIRPELKYYKEPLSLAKKAIPKAYKLKFEPYEIFNVVFDDIYKQCNNYGLIAKEATDAFNHNSLYFMYKYHSGEAYANLAKFDDAIEDLNTAFYAAVEDASLPWDKRVYEGQSFGHYVFGKLIAVCIVKKGGPLSEYEMKFYKSAFQRANDSLGIKSIEDLGQIDIPTIVSYARTNYANDPSIEVGYIQAHIFPRKKIK
ncbi:MAG TPA: hypothetical protein VGQ59_01005, partial [Cyclobacteriaceae bacterium]|nr:hypothetical protein [Cyclobacteriaceae bacterium]